MQSEWCLQTEKLLNVAALEIEFEFARKILCSQLYCDYERRKCDEFLRGVCSNINTDDLHLFFKLLLWNIDIYEFLFQAGYFKANLGSQCQKTAWQNKNEIIFSGKKASIIRAKPLDFQAINGEYMEKIFSPPNQTRPICLCQLGLVRFHEHGFQLLTYRQLSS